MTGGPGLHGVLLPTGLGRRLRPLLARGSDPVHDDARLRGSGREHYGKFLLHLFLQGYIRVKTLIKCVNLVLQLTHLDVDRNPWKAGVEPLQALEEVSAQLPHRDGFATARPNVDLLQVHEEKERAYMKSALNFCTSNAFRSGNEYG